MRKFAKVITRVSQEDIKEMLESHFDEHFENASPQKKPTKLWLHLTSIGDAVGFGGTEDLDIAPARIAEQILSYLGSTEEIVKFWADNESLEHSRKMLFERMKNDQLSPLKWSEMRELFEGELEGQGWKIEKFSKNIIASFNDGKYKVFLDGHSDRDPTQTSISCVMKSENGFYPAPQFRLNLVNSPIVEWDRIFSSHDATKALRTTIDSAFRLFDMSENLFWKE